MIYELYIEDLSHSKHTLYYPADNELVISDASLTQNVGQASEFSFSIPSTNLFYEDVVEKNIVTLTRDDEEIFRGEIREVSTDFQLNKTVYCVEDLTWLNNVPVPIQSDKSKSYGQWLQSLVATYNSKIGNAKQHFTAGYITNVESASICTFVEDDYEATTLSTIRKNICRDNGYIRVRRQGNSRYIDVVKLEDYGKTNSQSIVLGYNLLDYTDNLDCNNMVNVLNPYGAEIEDSIAFGDVLNRIKGTSIQNNASISSFGRIERSVIFETESVDTLNRLAQAYLARYSQPSFDLKLTALDLTYMDSNIDSIEIGDSVEVIAEPFSVNKRMFVTEKITNIQNIADNTITVSDDAKVKNTITNAISQAISDIDVIPTSESILTAARNQATALLNGANGGNIVFGFNSNNQLSELYITDNLDLSKARKIWRWNINGWGYTNGGINGTYTIAATMDGGIVADFITTGTLNAALLRGQTLDIGGSISGTYKNGAIVVRNSSNQEIGRWDNNGINVTSGAINLGNNTWNSQGLTIKQGSINLGNSTWNSQGLTINGGVISSPSIRMPGTRGYLGGWSAETGLLAYGGNLHYFTEIDALTISGNSVIAAEEAYPTIYTALDKDGLNIRDDNTGKYHVEISRNSNGATIKSPELTLDPTTLKIGTSVAYSGKVSAISALEFLTIRNVTTNLQATYGGYTWGTATIAAVSKYTTSTYTFDRGLIVSI